MRPFYGFSAALVAAVVCTAVLWSPANSDDRKTFTIRQDAPTLTPVDLGASGASHGDMLAFEAAIADESGTVGTLSGILITVDLPDMAGDDFEDRVGQLTFDLGNGNSLVVAGKSLYPPKGVEMNPNAPQLRAVVGGTGTFIGARGQVTTSRNDDGTYTHAFELVD